MIFDRFSEIWPLWCNLLFSTWNGLFTYTIIPGHLDRRTRTVQFQIKDSHVEKVVLDVVQQTAYPYTSRKYDKNWIEA